MTCKNCFYHQYPTDLMYGKGCKLWTDFKLNIKRLPIDTRCPGCGGYQPITPNEFVSEITKMGPSKYVISNVTMGNIDRYGGVITYDNEKCLFYKEKSNARS